jgi:hypothetical protein
MKNQTSHLLFKLVIPLSVLAIISLLLEGIFNGCLIKNNFFLNLATEIIGIIITIWFVDKTLKTYNEQMWKKADKIIAKRIEDVLYGMFLEFAMIFNLLNTIEAQFSVDERRKSPLDVLEFIPKYFVALTGDKQFHERIYGLDINEIKEIFDASKKYKLELAKIIDTFLSRMTPEQIELLVSTQNILEQTIRWTSVTKFWDKSVQSTDADDWIALKNGASNKIADLLRECMTTTYKFYEKTKTNVE